MQSGRGWSNYQGPVHVARSATPTHLPCTTVLLPAVRGNETKEICVLQIYKFCIWLRFEAGCKPVLVTITVIITITPGKGYYTVYSMYYT